METDIRKRIPTFFLGMSEFLLLQVSLSYFAKLAYYVDIGKFLCGNLLNIFQKGAFSVNVMALPVVGCRKVMASAWR